MDEISDGMNKILSLLKQPQFRKIAESIDCIIVFKNGKHQKTIRREVRVEG